MTRSVALDPDEPGLVPGSSSGGGLPMLWRRVLAMRECVAVALGFGGFVGSAAAAAAPSNDFIGGAADPLSGTAITDTLNGKKYHLQELAFFSWFYRSSPSLGANGWFSSNGTFRTSAAPCTG